MSDDLENRLHDIDDKLDVIIKRLERVSDDLAALTKGLMLAVQHVERVAGRELK